MVAILAGGEVAMLLSNNLEGSASVGREGAGVVVVERAKVLERRVSLDC